jgi:hypothetical protein
LILLNQHILVAVHCHNNACLAHCSAAALSECHQHSSLQLHTKTTIALHIRPLSEATKNCSMYTTKKQHSSLVEKYTVQMLLMWLKCYCIKVINYSIKLSASCSSNYQHCHHNQKNNNTRPHKFKLKKLTVKIEQNVYLPKLHACNKCSNKC